MHGVKESCNFKNVLHAKLSNFTNTQKNQPNFQGCWGEMKKWSEKNCVIFFKERPSKLETGYSQDMVEQTVV